jgi:hypothetical protein
MVVTLGLLRLKQGRFGCRVSSLSVDVAGKLEEIVVSDTLGDLIHRDAQSLLRAGGVKHGRSPSCR